MTRDTVICFRTSEELRKALEKISETDRRSLSSTIEKILYAHVERKEPKGFAGEKRRYSRKKTSAPALVSGLDGTVYAGIVHDMSLGGIHLSAPQDFPCELREDFRISVVFTLPGSERPLTMQCIPRHMRSGVQTSIGASFVDTDFQSYQTLQSHLVS